MDYGIIQVMKVIVSLCLFAILPVMAVSVPALPESEFCDTEVFTNVAFNAVRNDARHFGVSMAFMGTESNCVQVAFGHDADGDGNLEAVETGFVLGWRGGAYFIEDAAGQNRLVEPTVGVAHADRRFVLSAKLNAHSVPVQVSVSNECGACFAVLSENVPSWIFNRKWNLMKVTRRGVEATSESVDVECRYSFFRIVIR
jgi:hypothetical protein